MCPSVRLGMFKSWGLAITQHNNVIITYYTLFNINIHQQLTIITRLFSNSWGRGLASPEPARYNFYLNVPYYFNLSFTVR